MKSSEYIRSAMTHLANGWCQGERQDAYGNVCAYGALEAALPGTNALSEECGWATAILKIQSLAVELGHQSYLFMNDDPNTTQQDMLNLFEKAAISLEEIGQ